MFPDSQLFSWDYILILEWLPFDSHRTGACLRDWLQQNRSSIPTRYYSCDSVQAVEDTISKAASNVPQFGCPLLHIECHGGSKGLSGDANSFSGFLEWEKFGDILRPLNLKTKFNLVLVSAACEGFRGIFSVENAIAAPFYAIVGPSTKIDSGSLLEATKELYRNLTHSNANLGLAVREANLQLKSNQEEIRFSPVAHLLFDVVKSAAEENLLEPNRTRLACQRANEAISNRSDLTFDSAFHIAHDTVPTAVKKILSRAWETWFAFNEIPENRLKFFFNIDNFVKQTTISGIKS